MVTIKNYGKSFNKDFFDIALNIYKDDKNWACPPNSEIKNIFSTESNQLLKNGDYTIFIAYKNNIPSGRLIAFWTTEKSKKRHPYSGGIAFFECINSTEVSNMLFSEAVQWLKNQNIEAVDAITIPGENYNHWGILIDGFIKQGFGMPYNKPYYESLFEEFGFNEYFRQYSYHVDLTKEFPDRHVRYANHIIDSGEFEFKHLKMSESDSFVEDVLTIFNDVWSQFHADHSKVKKEYVEKMFKDLKFVANEKFIWLAYKDKYPIGMTIALPDINQIIGSFKGRLNIFNKIKLVNNIKKVKRARLLAFGVHPENQSSGVAQALYVKMAESMKSEGITELEMSWVGDYNPKVNRIYKHLGNSVLAKTHATMRYMINKNYTFERFTNQ